MLDSELRSWTDVTSDLPVLGGCSIPYFLSKAGKITDTDVEFTSLSLCPWRRVTVRPQLGH